jgi:hypothetical protein
MFLASIGHGSRLYKPVESSQPQSRVRIFTSSMQKDVNLDVKRTGLVLVMGESIFVRINALF